MPEPLPRGAQFTRAKTLWEIALHVAGDPAIPYYGNRDIMIAIGNASGETFKPVLRMSVGSPILARGVVRGDLECGFVNPSAMLTQAYRGTGLYNEPLPVRVIANWPSWDRFVVAVNPSLGLRSLAEIREKRLPLRFSIREDDTHSTRVLIDQLLPLYGYTLEEAQSWGVTLQLNGPPMDPRRISAIREKSVDVVFDEGIMGWLNVALENGMKPLDLEPDIMQKMVDIGWRKVVLPKSRFPLLDRDYDVIDYSGWPLYTRESLPDEQAYKIAEAFSAREAEFPWDRDSYTGLNQLGEDTDATPIDVPLHPGAARYYREQGYNV